MESTVLALLGASWVVLPGGHSPAEVVAVTQLVEANGSTADFTLPLVMGEDGDSAVTAMNEAMSWETITGESLEETIEAFSQIQGGYIGSDCTVNYNAGGILDITLRVEFLGAYPSTGFSRFCFDVSTGRSVRFSELLRPGCSETLAVVLDSMLQANIAAEAADSPLDPQMYEGHRFGVENLESFSIAENGVWFHYDFGFPHAILAAEPDGELFIPAEAVVPLLLEGYAGRTDL